MKAVIALAASVAVANAALMPRQDGLSSIPQCALSCALGSLGDTGCQPTDFACICKATSFITGLVPCVQKGCSADDFEKTLTAAKGLCQQAGVSLSVPAGVTETGTPSATESSSAPAATTTAPTTEVTEVTSASSEPTSAVTSAAVTSAVTSAAATTTEAPTMASGSNSTVSSTSPPQPSGTEPSAADRNTIALGGLGAAVIALVAAFL
ncbi:hypothetical protein AA313_de0202710 [Arthrobotrys entomopaga]|nr:hypothetical protein AA313_de0202710 [Arthrobotrys entomopaga]